MKLVNKRCLSDSRLSSDEDYLALTFKCVGEIAVQLSHSGFATDHFPGAVDARVRRCSSTSFTHRGYELIPPPRKRFNEFRFLVPITQGLTDAQNIFLDDLWVYICLRPKRPEYFILRYETIRMLDKVAQYIESLRGERHPVFSVPQAVVDGVEPEGIKLFHLPGQFASQSRQEVRGRSTSESLRH
jgi:hypothetical protein